jgi:hypothetical protein
LKQPIFFNRLTEIRLSPFSNLNKELLMIARGNEYEARWPQLATLDTDEAQEEVTLAYQLKLDRLMMRLLQSTDGQAEVEMPPNESIATILSDRESITSSLVEGTSEVSSVVRKTVDRRCASRWHGYMCPTKATRWMKSLPEPNDDAEYEANLLAAVEDTIEMKDNRYSVRLPWLKREEMGNNFRSAMFRLRRLDKRPNSSPQDESVQSFKCPTASSRVIVSKGVGGVNATS